MIWWYIQFEKTVIWSLIRITTIGFTLHVGHGTSTIRQLTQNLPNLYILKRKGSILIWSINVLRCLVMKQLKYTFNKTVHYSNKFEEKNVVLGTKGKYWLSLYTAAWCGLQSITLLFRFLHLIGTVLTQGPASPTKMQSNPGKLKFFLASISYTPWNSLVTSPFILRRIFLKTVIPSES